MGEEIEEGNRTMDIFQLSKLNLVKDVYDLLQNETSPNDCDDNGCTPLHICSTYGSCETAALLLKWNADHTLQDYENGWTPLHRSIYFGHIKITLLLLKAGAQLTRPHRMETTLTRRSLRNVREWVSPIDHEGLSPLDLLSIMNRIRYRTPDVNSLDCSTSVVTFGKSDFFLGIPLPRSSLSVSKPRAIHDLEAEHIINLTASKFHSAALTSDGRVFTWGHGKGGRLGHGSESNLPSPTFLVALGEVHVVLSYSLR